MSIEIQKIPKRNNQVTTIYKSEDVFLLKEVQEIKDAVQEHLLFIGLDTKNQIRNISLVGIGTSKSVGVDSKYIIRTALVTASDKVILVHNHPSNILIPSRDDKHITNFTSKLLKIFNIEFLDHIIVGETGYMSMGEEAEIEIDNKTEMLEYVLLLEENDILKNEIQILKDKLKNKEKNMEDEEECE